ncbi:GNAT family N-acetyltransferase [Paenibacillus sp. FSL R7-277]|uniref:GNAT family N-acetyltransferase n=1 Tax=unclassified Paenibacillus TaxID=185978 RepID=UPI0003E2C426|nr:GNAT family N-acetyltransferase [Paenibacillus sp. FSL R7-277]ETT70358.1 GCN5-like N-acetyltransferase [Paenibacillus sp. FSL R7-277]
MIREARAEDAAGIEGLYRILLPDSSDIHVSPQRISQIADNPDSLLFVYVEGGEVAGTVHLHLCMDALSGDRPFAVIERFVIIEELRGKGIGASMLRFAEEAAAARGALKVMLSSKSIRKDAHRFYERLGYDGEGSKLFKKYISLQPTGGTERK